ncbi:hypothetical protein ACFL7M_18135 [Thermodesulfobacteriota bacterium]
MTDTERREKVRLRPENLTFVAVRPEFAKLGRLLDITIDGLCFQYMAHGDLVEYASSIEVDIFMNNNGYYLQSIPCEFIYDTVIEKEETLPTGVEFRRCGLHFVKLSKEHIDQLELYIKEYTAKMVQFQV